MKGQHVILSLSFVLIALAVAAGLSQAQTPGPQAAPAPQATPGTAFTYQGQLKKSGVPVSASCSFRFLLFDVPSGGSPIAPQVDKFGVAVSNGLFTVQLDFGAGAFNGDARWLGITVMCPGETLTDLGRQQLTPAPYALALPGLQTRQNATSPNIIGGYSGNTVSASAVGATIGGGGAWTNPNYATAYYATVGGGAGNTASGYASVVGGGGGYGIPAYGMSGPLTNTASGEWSVVAGGEGNTAGNVLAAVGGGGDNRALGRVSTIGGGGGNKATGDWGTVGGGDANVAGGRDSTVGGGWRNQASGQESTIPGGYGAVASHYGQFAYASGPFSWNGDAQTSIFVLRGITGDATPKSLSLHGGDFLERITLTSETTIVFDVQVAARSTIGYSAGYWIWGVIERHAGITRMVGAGGMVIAEDSVAIPWNAVAAADDVNDCLDIQVTGAAGTPIRWVAVVRTSEVSY